jgi:hypothetical protein
VRRCAAVTAAHAGAVARPDNFTIPVNQVLSVFVSANDDMPNAPGTTYVYELETSLRFFAPGSTTAQTARGLDFNTTGGITFDPAKGGLKAGTRVTFTYAILAGTLRYKTGTGVVDIYITYGPAGGVVLPRAPHSLGCIAGQPHRRNLCRSHGHVDEVPRPR